MSTSTIWTLHASGFENKTQSRFPLEPGIRNEYRIYRIASDLHFLHASETTPPISIRQAIISAYIHESNNALEVTIEPSRESPLRIDLPGLNELHSPTTIAIPADESDRRNIIYLTPGSIIRFPTTNAYLTLLQDINPVAPPGVSELQVAASAEPSQINGKPSQRLKPHLHTQLSAAPSKVEETPRKVRTKKDINMATESQPFSTAKDGRAQLEPSSPGHVHGSDEGAPHSELNQSKEASSPAIDADDSTDSEDANHNDTKSDKPEEINALKEAPSDAGVSVDNTNRADQHSAVDVLSEVHSEMDIDAGDSPTHGRAKHFEDPAIETSPPAKKRKHDEIGSDDERLASNKKKVGNTYAKSNNRTKSFKSPLLNTKAIATQPATSRKVTVTRRKKQSSEDAGSDQAMDGQEKDLNSAVSEEAAIDDRPAEQADQSAEEADQNQSRSSAFTPINTNDSAPLTPTSPEPASVAKKRGRGRPSKTKAAASSPVSAEIVHPSVEVSESSEPAKISHPSIRISKSSAIADEEISVQPSHSPAATADSTSSTNRKKLHIAFSGTSLHEQVTLRKFLLRHAHIDDHVTERTDFVCTGKGSLKRTTKVLLALIYGKPIISDQWIIHSTKHSQLLDPEDYLASDPTVEKKAGIDPGWSKGASRQDLLESITLYFTPAAKKDYGATGWDGVKKIANLAGVHKILTGKHASVKLPIENLVALGMPKEDSDIIAMSENGVPCFDREWLPLTILRGEVDLEDETTRIAQPADEKEKGKKGRGRRSKN